MGHGSVSSGTERTWKFGRPLVIALVSLRDDANCRLCLGAKLLRGWCRFCNSSFFVEAPAIVLRRRQASGLPEARLRGVRFGTSACLLSPRQQRGETGGLRFRPSLARARLDQFYVYSTVIFECAARLCAAALCDADADLRDTPVVRSAHRQLGQPLSCGECFLAQYKLWN